MYSHLFQLLFIFFLSTSCFRLTAYFLFPADCLLPVSGHQFAKVFDSLSPGGHGTTSRAGSLADGSLGLAGEGVDQALSSCFTGCLCCHAFLETVLVTDT